MIYNILIKKNEEQIIKHILFYQRSISQL